MSSLVSNLMHWLNTSLQLKDGLYRFVVERFKLRAGKNAARGTSAGMPRGKMPL